MTNGRKLMCAVVLAGAAIPSALAADGYEAPGIKNPGTWKALLVAAVAAVAICVAAFKNARRTHLD